MPRLSYKFWMTLVTLLLVAIVVFFSWNQIVRAWAIVSRGGINYGICVLLLPVQFLSYFARGQITYLYLKSKNVSRLKMARFALETNFVDHIAVVNGVAGIAYLSWALSPSKISASKAAMAQLISYLLCYASMIVLLVVAVLSLVIEQKAGIPIIMISIVLIAAIVGLLSAVIYAINNRRRITKISNWLATITNRTASSAVFQNFFERVHQNYNEIRRNKKILVRPFAWSLLAVTLDASLILIVFVAMGVWVNPAIIFIAYSLSSFASMLAVTPGGAGVYELVMITLLAISGVTAEVAIVGTLLTRVLLLLGVLAFGYVFYQDTVNRHDSQTPNNYLKAL